MADAFEAEWIRRGGWSVSLGQSLAIHHVSGCTFRVVRSGPLGSAFWIDASGIPPPPEQIEVMQSRAWAVFYLTEQLVQASRSRRR